MYLVEQYVAAELLKDAWENCTRINQSELEIQIFIAHRTALVNDSSVGVNLPESVGNCLP